MKLWCSRDGNGDRVIWLGNEDDYGDEPFYAIPPDFCRGSGEGILDERQDWSSIPIGVVRELLDGLFPEGLRAGEVASAVIPRLTILESEIMDGYGQTRKERTEREKINETRDE